MLKDIILLIAGTVLGYIFPLMIIKWKQYVLGKKTAFRKEIFSTGSVAAWLRRYYSENGSNSSLLHIQLSDGMFPVPFLIKSAWLYYQKLGMDTDMVKFDRSEKQFKVDKKLIEQKKRLNQKIFNEPALYIDELLIEDGALKINVKKCSYFEMISAMSRLEEESFYAIKNQKFSNLELRDKYLKNAQIAGMPHDLPFSVGCVVLLAFKTEQSYDILIHKRSSSTATYSGYRSVIPSFGLAPLPKEISGYSISFYNFIKEFAEELYDLEELNQLMLSKRGNISWFLELPEIKEILQAFGNGQMEYVFTGFGIDTFNGTNTLSYLCAIHDVTLSQKIRNKIKGNWEVEASDEEPSFSFIDIHDPGLNRLLVDSFHFGSAFCVQRGIDYLNKP